MTIHDETIKGDPAVVRHPLVRYSPDVDMVPNDQGLYYDVQDVEADRAALLQEIAGLKEHLTRTEAAMLCEADGFEDEHNTLLARVEAAEATITALRDLVQRWRLQGERLCPNIDPPLTGWTSDQMVARPLGAIRLDCADQLASLLAAASPGTEREMVELFARQLDALLTGSAVPYPEA